MSLYIDHPCSIAEQYAQTLALVTRFESTLGPIWLEHELAWNETIDKCDTTLPPVAYSFSRV